MPFQHLSVVQMLCLLKTLIANATTYLLNKVKYKSILSTTRNGYHTPSGSSSQGQYDSPLLIQPSIFGVDEVDVISVYYSNYKIYKFVFVDKENRKQ